MSVIAVDLSPLYHIGNQLISSIAEGAVTALCAWAVYAFHRWLAPWLGSQFEAQLAANLNTALTNGVAAAMVQLQAYETAHKDAAVQGAVQRLAVQYAADHAPDAVKYFGLSPDDLARKALAYIPLPPPSAAGTTGATVIATPVQSAPLPNPA